MVDEIYLIISARKPRACQIVMVRPRSKNFEFSNKTYVPPPSAKYKYDIDMGLNTI
ncbi:MAG: hypothetical protein ACP5LE_04650 [Thermoplasmata archaeon]